MLGSVGHRRSRRFIASAVLALAAQAMLVMVTPLADVHYHRFGPVQIESAGSHHATRGSGPCPECIALQTMAVPGSAAHVVRSTWSWQAPPTAPMRVVYAVVRPTTQFARAPPTPPREIL